MTAVGKSDIASYMDMNLKSDTTYKYTVTAIDAAGNESIKSDTLAVTTKEQSSSYEQWDSFKAYTKGDRVEHQGKTYEAVQSYQGYGDPNWIFALSLWNEI
ncbi:Carbohydrate binding domain-containing protein [Bacillus sp. OK838]|nr:Carbohydrate binding domain-containing protein [Bacillus sp. OK838]